MESYKVKGIVLSSVDYKDKDKLVNIFTLEYGLVCCNLKSVKSNKAKLKFAKEIFCFGEFLISSPLNIITAVEVESNFFEITKDLDKFYCGCAMLEAVKSVLSPKEQNVPLFLELLKCIGGICYENTNPKYFLIKFLLFVFDNCGYALMFDNCRGCNGELIHKKYINFDIGEIVCSGCKTANCVEISNRAFSCLKIINKTEHDKLKTLKLATGSEDEALEILVLNFQKRFNKKLVLI